MKVILRKALSLLCAGLIFTGALVGCSNSSNPSQSSSQVQQDNVEIKDELVISMGAYPPGYFDPLKRWGLYSQTQILHSALLKKNAALEILPDYAQKYTISDDGLIWTFHLNDDFYFSNGEKVTAEDVVYTYEMLKEDGVNWDLTFLEKVTIIDPLTVEFTLSEVNTVFFAHLTEIGILPRNHYDENYGSDPIGSGPYMLTQWDVDQQAILEINPYYHGKTPHFKKVTLLFMDENSALAAAKNGTADFIYILPEFAEEKIDGFKLFSFESIDVRGVSLPTLPVQDELNERGFTVGNNVTSDIAIRRALYIGVNRQAMANTVLNGHGRPAYSLCDGMPWFNEAMIVEDSQIETAKQLLEEAGWVDSDGDGIREKDGLRAQFDLYHASNDQVRTALAIVFAEQALELGIQVDCVGSNWDEIQTKMHSNSVLYAGGRHYPYPMYIDMHPDMSGIGYGNIVYYNNPAVTKHMDDAIVSSDLLESYEHWKLAQWDGKNGINFDGDVPYVWCVRLDHIHLGDARIDVGDQPIHMHGHEWSVLYNLGEWRWNPNATANLK